MKLMKYYFNEMQYDSLTSLQDRYTQFLDSNDTSFYFKIIDDDNEIILDHKFIKNKQFKLLPIFLHYTIQCNMIEHIDEICYSQMLEDILNFIDDMYIDFYIETHQSDEVSLLKVHTDDYTDYISTQELVHMAEQCALFDIENNLSIKSFDQLTEEYYNLSTECLVNEYEKIYSVDYHVEHLHDMILKTDDMKIKEIISKNKTNYLSSKNHILKNNIVLERKIK